MRLLYLLYVGYRMDESAILENCMAKSKWHEAEQSAI